MTIKKNCPVISVSSVVKFTDAAFKNPYHYLSQSEDASTVRRYEEYMCGANTTSDIFKVRMIISSGKTTKVD